MSNARFDNRTAELIDPPGLTLPKGNKLFVESFAKLMKNQPELEHLRESNISEEEFIKRREQEVYYRLFSRSLATGVHPQVTSETFVMALKALEFQRDKPFNISSDREAEILRLMERLRTEGESSIPPRSLSDPYLLRRAVDELKNSQFTKMLTDLRGHPRRMMNIGTEIVGELKTAIAEIPEEDKSRAAPILNQALQQIEQKQLAALNPGAHVIKSAGDFAATLKTYSDRLGTEDVNALRVSNVIAQVSAQLERLATAEPKPGKLMTEEVGQYVHLLTELKYIATDSGNSVALELAGALETQIAKVQTETLSGSGVEQQINTYNDEVKKIITDLRGQLEQFKGSSWSVYGNWAARLSNNLERRADKIQNQHEAAQNKEIEFYREVQAKDELEYLELIASFHSTIHAYSNQTNTASFEDQVAAVANMKEALALANPEMLAEMEKDFAIYEQGLARVDTDEAESAGMLVRNRRPTFNVGIWQGTGATPAEQGQIDRLQNCCAVMHKVGGITDVLKIRFAEVHKQAAEQNWAPEKLETECRKILSECWSQVHQTRESLVLAAKQTSDRCLRQGVDNLAPLTDRQLLAFSLVLEQQQRTEQGQLEQHQSQRSQVWQDSFVAQPVSDLIAGGIRNSSLQSLSGSELSSRAAEFGDDYRVAQNMYECISQEMLGSGDGNKVPGYQTMITALERVGVDAYRDLPFDVSLLMIQRETAGTVAYAPSGGMVKLTTPFEEAFHGVANAVLAKLGSGQTVMSGQEAQTALQGILSEYVIKNNGREDTLQLQQKALQFLSKYQHIYSQFTQPGGGTTP